MSSGEAVITAFYAMEEGRWSDVKNIVFSLVKDELEKPSGVPIIFFLNLCNLILYRFGLFNVWLPVLSGERK